MISKRKAHRLLLAGIAPLVLPLSAFASPPADATAKGMTVNTFSSTFTPATVDINDTKNRGYKWYLLDLFGQVAKPAWVKLNGDGSMTMTGQSGGPIGTLASAIPYRGTNSFVGNSFSGGGYFEAQFHYDPAQVQAQHASGVWHPYPAMWGLPMQGNILKDGNQWPGQPAGYVHNVEFDFFEAAYVNKPTSYGSGLHDWYGIQNQTCKGYCVVNMLNPTGERKSPAGTDFRQYHTYGVLWVSATATTKGSYMAYFDGQPIGHEVQWTQYTNQAPTPVGKTWTFGRLDQQHVFFILGTGTGEPMTIRSVNVWQRNTSNNMTN